MKSVLIANPNTEANGLEAKIYENRFLELIYLLCNFPELNRYKYLRANNIFTKYRRPYYECKLLYWETA